MPPKRNNRRTTNMTEEEIDALMNLPLACFSSDGVLASRAKKEAQAREEADREEKAIVAREVAAREAAANGEGTWSREPRWIASNMRANQKAVRVAMDRLRFSRPVIR
jgi:hypothetical protein